MPTFPRDEIVKAARDKTRRKVGMPPKEPNYWAPGQVINPETGMSFTPIGVWDWIADQLESGIDVNHRILEKPPGQDSWWFKATLQGNPRDLYVKITYRGGIVIGRSFHLDR